MVAKLWVMKLWWWNYGVENIVSKKGVENIYVPLMGRYAISLSDCIPKNHGRYELTNFVMFMI